MHVFKQNNKVYCVIIMLVQLIASDVSAQIKSFSVNKVPFSSSIGDDFSPVFYKNGIVYCSNSITTAAINVKSENENLFNIIFVGEKDSGHWKSPEIFSAELTTILNEGPATFTSDGNKIYYARNNLTEGKFKEINKPSNKLGIYSAELINGIWTNITALPFNNSEFSFGTPSLSSDGLRLYFASDKPGGYGGTDIYFCNFENGNWADPINMGPKINTSFDEAYPYACASGRVFFSSNGHNSFGGKDIFYTLEQNGNWIDPIHLDEAINSTADDFGIVTDINFETGYFSSNRKNNTDIYSFSADYPHFGLCTPQPEFKQCYKFYDERFTDTLHLEHEWDFGNGIKKKGISVEQCFSQPGNNTAVLTIIHRIADSTFKIQSEYNFDVEFPESPFILSETSGLANSSQIFTALSTNNNDKTTCFWDFGEGFALSGENVEHKFSNPGEYIVKMGIQGSKNTKGIFPRYCISKTIKIYDDYQQLATSIIEEKTNDLSDKKVITINENQNSFIIKNYYIGKFQGIKYIKLNTLLDSISKLSLFFDDENKMLSGTQSIIDIYIDILNNDPQINLFIAIHQNKKGSSKNNKEITGQLAANIQNYMLSRVINNARINCVGYGNTRPLAGGGESENTTERIEFILIDNNFTAIK